jgi:DNA-binding SARP family transcriptional activator
MAGALEIRLFGNVEIHVDGRLVSPIRSRKGTLLLAMLTLRHGKEVDREFLASSLWSESVQAQAFYNLRQALVLLRKALGSHAYRLTTPTNRTVRFDLSGGYADVDEFDGLVRSENSASLRSAIALYRGPLLQEFVEDWLIDPRETRQLAYIKALATVAQECESTGAYSEAVQLMRHVVAINPWDEAQQRGLMRALAANGELTAAATVYREFSDLLYRESHATPDAETEQLYSQIRSRARLPGADPPAGNRQEDKLTPASPPISPPAERDHARPSSVPVRVEPAGGAVPLDSPFYLPRNEDAELLQALASGDSIILLKGARQMGKTSLLARGIDSVRRSGARIVHSDLETYDPEQMATADAVYLGLAQDLADQLDLTVSPEAAWGTEQSANRKLERYLRDYALRPFDSRVVWAVDSVDVLSGRDYSSSIFGLFRSWHNRRALDPDGPWRKLTLMLIYSTEAHLLIQDRHQSPFNVGRTIALSDFTLEQVHELNGRYGSPLTGKEEMARFFALLSGHPYLTSLGLAEMCSRRAALADILASGDKDGGLFGSHLRHILTDLRRDPALVAALAGILTGETPAQSQEFYRLRSAGIIVGDSVQTAVMRCPLYRSYLSRNLL